MAHFAAEADKSGALVMEAKRIAKAFGERQWWPGARRLPQSYWRKF
jgi:hypothetical protein